MISEKQKESQRIASKKYRNSKKGQKTKKEYYQRPEIKKRQKEYYQRPESLQKNREYHQRPEVKQRRKERDEKNKKHRKEYGKKWRAKNKDYDRTRNREWAQKNPEKIHQRYLKRKEKCSEYYREYRKTKSGMDAIKKRDAKRNRDLDWVKLFNNPFPKDVDIHWHHINNKFVLPLPKKIHIKTFHKNREEHRERANVWLYYLYGIDFDLLINQDGDDNYL